MGPGGRVWDGAQILAGFLAANAGTLIRGKRILELGAGTGLPGLVCALSGAHTGKQSCALPASAQFFMSITLFLFTVSLAFRPNSFWRGVIVNGLVEGVASNFTQYGCVLLPSS